MASYLSKSTKQSLEELIEFVIDSKEYRMCKQLQETISKDKELLKLIDKVRKKQKEYVQSMFSKEKEEQLNELLFTLNHYETYKLYSYYVDKVNDMINLIKDELNTYFYNISNIL